MISDLKGLGFEFGTFGQPEIAANSCPVNCILALSKVEGAWTPETGSSAGPTSDFDCVAPAAEFHSSHEPSTSEFSKFRSLSHGG